MQDKEPKNSGTDVLRREIEQRKQIMQDKLSLKNQKEENIKK